MKPPLPMSLRRFPLSKFAAIVSLTVTATLGLDCFTSLPTAQRAAEAQTPQGQAMTLRSDIQEANAKTGVITARGNVQINYPARQIQATATQAQYFSRERRIVLSGNVYVLQQGNSLRGEVITYLIDEGRFVAVPQSPRQVEAIYLVPDNPPPAAPTPGPAPFSDKPEFTAPEMPSSGSR